MKPHTVKSNAKRAARKIAEAAPEKWEVVEPEAAPGGGWFGTVRAKLPGLTHDLVVVLPAEAPPPFATLEAEGVGTINLTAENVSGVDDKEISLALGASFTPAKPPVKPKPADLPAKPKPLAGSDFAKVVADIPKTRSSAAEIEARRAERRSRVEEEKAVGLRDAAGNKIDPAKVAKGPKRADIIVRLASRPDGVTVEDLMKATGWQRHTLRGYIAGTLRKRGHAIECVQAKGEPTRYQIKADAA